MAKTFAGNVMRGYYKTMVQAAETALLNAASDIESTGRDAVREWKNKPDFKDTTERSQQRIEVTIKPKGNKKVLQIFKYVEKGTKGPYLIPKFVQAGKFLRFQTGYSARTQPTARYNMGTGRSFGSWVTKKQVLHPGIKPRKFLETFMTELIPPLHVRVQQEITRQLG